MKNYLFLLFALLSLLFSCQVKSKRISRKEKTSGESTEASVGITEPLDTSLTDLRTKRAIASLQAMAQNWNLDDVDQVHWTHYMWDSVRNKRKFPGLSLFPDGVFTFNPRADLKTGTWKVDKEKSLLTLKYAEGDLEHWTVTKITMSKFHIIADDVVPPLEFKYTSQSIIHNQPEEDPFYPVNNLWRIKPAKPESPGEIKKRVKNFVHFWMLFFKDNHLRHETDISYIGLPSCLVWYNGGIGLQQEFDIDKKWIDCFYSEKQAREAYALLGQVISSKTLKWPEHPTSWVKQLYEVLEQMENKI
jgi:hypothetical protein